MGRGGGLKHLQAHDVLVTTLGRPHQRLPVLAVRPRRAMRPAEKQTHDGLQAHPSSKD